MTGETIAFVRQYLKTMANRASVLGADLFADPAWIIILEVYLAQHDRKPISVSSACIGSGAPPSTALRHIMRLENAGLISRHPDRSDNRRVHLRLSDDGEHRIASLLQILQAPLKPSLSARHEEASLP